MGCITKFISFIFVLIVSIAGITYYYFNPDFHNGKIEIESNYGPASIIFDKQGVAHIFADTEESALFAQGYTHCRDRYFAMDKMRRLAKGRLSEMAGSSSLELDKLMRTLSIWDVSKETWENMKN